MPEAASQRPSEPPDPAPSPGEPELSVPSVAEKREDGKFELDDEKLDKKIRQAVRAESYSGPMPHPAHLERYDATLPGAAKILFDEFQANSAHQREMEREALSVQKRALELKGRDNEESAKRDARSQHYAAALIILGLLAAAWFVHVDAEWIAALVIGTLLISVITGFLANRNDTKPPSSDQPDSQEDADGS